MITVSVCLIVKNEEKVLSRCLDSLKEIADEIIIVDTGSTDGTKKVAAKYTSKIYDFEWISDFAAARNYAFSKAECDYIYSADADEVVDETNRMRFLNLKKCMLDEIEIVQMYYCNQLEYNTTYNFDRELRPKLFKRLRTFKWIDPVHESIRLEPVVYDSDIEIIHMPENLHSSRDFALLLKACREGKSSRHLWEMYARELFISGEDKDFVDAYEVFKDFYENTDGENCLRMAQCVLARAARVMKNVPEFFSYCIKNVAMGKASSEVCCEMGKYYYSIGNLTEARLWFYNAVNEAEPELSIAYGREIPQKYLNEIES